MPVCIRPEDTYTQVMGRNDTSATSPTETEQNQLQEDLRPGEIGLRDYDPKLNFDARFDDDDDDDDTRVSTSSIVRQIEEREAIFDLLDAEEDDEGTKPESSSDSSSMHSALEQNNCKQSATHKQTSTTEMDLAVAVHPGMDMCISPLRKETETETLHVGTCMSPVPQQCSVTPLSMDSKFSPTPSSLDEASPSRTESPPHEQTEDYFSRNLSENPVMKARVDLKASSAFCGEKVANMNPLQEQNCFLEHHATREPNSKSPGLQPPPTASHSFSPLLRLPTNPPQPSCRAPLMSVIPPLYRQPSFGSGNPQSSFFSSTIPLRSWGAQEQKNMQYLRSDPIPRPHPPLNQGGCYSFLNEGICRRPVCRWLHQV